MKCVRTVNIMALFSWRVQDRAPGPIRFWKAAGAETKPFALCVFLSIIYNQQDCFIPHKEICRRRRAMEQQYAIRQKLLSEAANRVSGSCLSV
jgi:hypothetical protein